MNKPNVLLISIDSLRADRLSCYGHSKLTTPNIDRLAKEGILFSQAITGGSWTQAAFPVLLTSTYASTYGGCLGPLSPERPSPIEALSEQGYTTAGFSTSPLLSRNYGYARGFRQFFDLLPRESDPSLRRVKGGQKFLQNPLTHYIANLTGNHLRPARLYVSASDVTSKVCEWLNEVESSFFAWVHYMDVHWPYYLEEGLTAPKDIAQAWNDLSYLHEVNQQRKHMSPKQRQYYIELYEEAIKYTDEQVGRLFDYLESANLLDNTVIVLVSDHGEEFLERQHWGHVELNLYDEIMRVPLIFHLPGTNNQVVEHQVRLLDVMPTILDLCNCPAPDGMEGVSLTPLWTGDGNSYNNTVAICERWRNVGDISHIIAVRTDKFKYIWNINRPDQAELYDLVTDPEEKNNVKDRYPDQVKILHSHVEELLKCAEQTKPDTSVSAPELDQEVIERLRDLGYVE